ncbi:Predicted arabinose efflux permease, MFS family [Chitinasiproducens palmae]|uniref:Predicted arabinose efflux permease, MFS family n=2 Tax=Chitinasiproducens palmae TaxID=1770053 RepID=A0A1H2PQN9_9BURK|nr:Predicted arabinose efflux permease, MFS family [Chitinasiproducens palmae]
MTPWLRDFGWSRAEVSAVGALALCVMALAVSASGHAADRWGARRILVAGCVALGAGLAVVASMRHFWQFVLGYGVLGGLGFGLVSLPVAGSLVVRRVRHRQGIATGVATSGTTAGQLLILPAMTLLFAAIGWRGTFAAFAVACVGTAAGAYWLIGREPVSSPRGLRRPTAAGPAASGSLLRSRAFHGLFWSFALCGFTSTGVVETHLIPFARACGFAPMPSTVAYGVFAACNLLGMLGVGFLSDRVDRRRLLVGIYAVRSLAFVIPLFVGSNYALLVAFSALVGMAFYASFPATIGLSAAHFGKERLGLVMGVLTVGHAIGAAGGAYVSGYLFDLFLRYDSAWLLSIALAASSAVLAALVSDPRSATPAPLATGAGAPAPR